MRLGLFAVRDAKVEAFMNPFAARTRGEAMRGFGDAVLNKDSDFGKHPEDYALYKVGDYDSVTGVIDPCQPVIVETALAYLTEVGRDA